MIFFFFNDTATTEIYTLSLHDALPISDLQHSFAKPRAAGCEQRSVHGQSAAECKFWFCQHRSWQLQDRKSTRLNSSHSQISYAVFCLKKKKNNLAHIFLSLHITHDTHH